MPYLHIWNTWGTLHNHFSTIGVIGLNEMCENMLGCGITDKEGKAWSMEVLHFMRDKLSDFQEETGNFYNLEATPAEGCTYSLAKKDLEQYPGIITQGTEDAPYYTNSCHMPVYEVESMKQLVTTKMTYRCYSQVEPLSTSILMDQFLQDKPNTRSEQCVRITDYHISAFHQ